MRTPGISEHHSENCCSKGQPAPSQTNARRFGRKAYHWQSLWTACSDGIALLFGDGVPKTVYHFFRLVCRGDLWVFISDKKVSFPEIDIFSQDLHPRYVFFLASNIRLMFNALTLKPVIEWKPRLDGPVFEVNIWIIYLKKLHLWWMLRWSK